MSNQYFNFYYDPTSQGFDPLSWRSLFGTPTMAGTRLSVSSSTIIHLAQMLRGDFVFNLRLSAPASGDDRQIGLIQYNKNEYIYFRILDGILTAETSDGVTAYSTPITWQSEWSDVSTDFRIKWEAGSAKFYINGSLQATIGYSSLLDIPVSAVPNDAMSFFISDYGSTTPTLLNYIDASAIQSYLLLTSNSGVIQNNPIEELDRVAITESVTATVDNPGASVVESITITDVPTVGAPA